MRVNIYQLVVVENHVPTIVRSSSSPLIIYKAEFRRRLSLACTDKPRLLRQRSFIKHYCNNRFIKEKELTGNEYQHDPANPWAEQPQQATDNGTST